MTFCDTNDYQYLHDNFFSGMAHEELSQCIERTFRCNVCGLVWVERALKGDKTLCPDRHKHPKYQCENLFGRSD